MPRSHRPLESNWFPFGKAHSPDVVERLNGSARQTLGRTYGLESYETCELALHKIHGGLLEHDLANGFCLRTP